MGKKKNLRKGTRVGVAMGRAGATGQGVYSLSPSHHPTPLPVSVPAWDSKNSPSPFPRGISGEWGFPDQPLVKMSN